MRVNAGAWFRLLRPWSYAATLVPFLVAASVFGTCPGVDWTRWCAGLVVGLLFQATVNLLNTWGDNRFVDTDRQEVFDYMATRPEPWIAFKVLGAGVEHPRDAFPAAYDGGADFICCGMYDYQLVEDVNVANDYFAKGLPGRVRPWHG